MDWAAGNGRIVLPLLGAPRRACLARGEIRLERFGEGIVEQVVLGAAPAVVARFPGYGVKKVLANYLQQG